MAADGTAGTLMVIIINETLSSPDPYRIRGPVIYNVFYALSGVPLGYISRYIHSADQLFLVYALMTLAAFIPAFF
jgi:hypothetical protein